MATTYCQHADVSDFLQISAFTTGTTVTIAQVEKLINRREDFIDNVTGHAFRSVTVTNEHHNLKGDWRWDEGIKIHLGHRDIADPLSSGSGDSLEIWNGNEWEEWLGNKTESRKNDYWLNYEEGILYIRTQFFQRNMAIRITYRYGTTTIPQDIEQACVLLAAHDLILSEDRSAIMPEGGGAGVNYLDKANRFKEEAMDILRRRQELTVTFR